MRIAIVGAGFAGLAAAWASLKQKWQVTLFDRNGIGGGASSMAAGLLHPYPGEECRRSWQASSGIEKTLGLIAIAEEALGKKVVDRSGIVRILLNQNQANMFKSHCESFGDVSFLDAMTVLLSSGITVHCKNYLEGLWKACSKEGAFLVQEKVEHLSELDGFDQIILATGAETDLLENRLPLKKIKGQVIRFADPLLLSQTTIQKGYIARIPFASGYIAGATYEKHFTTSEPCLKVALSLLAPKIAPLLPSFQESQVLSCDAGVRLYGLGHYLPFAGKLKERVWVLTALGSRGLLYHAYLAELLISAITSEDETLLPDEVRCNPCKEVFSF